MKAEITEIAVDQGAFHKDRGQEINRYSGLAQPNLTGGIW